jgi:hypothetical protein
MSVKEKNEFLTSSTSSSTSSVALLHSLSAGLSSIMEAKSETDSEEKKPFLNEQN